VSDPRLGASWLDVGLVLLLFLWPPTTIWLWMVAREIRETRAAVRRLKEELGADGADGYPPPGPPTTVQPTENLAD
jgi:hypothetical protein